MDISVIIVSWNVCELLESCLASLKKYASGLEVEVIVVDNNSSDGSVAMIRRRHPWVTLIASKENLGFTKGNNVGLARATGRYIFYLNPDTELIEDALTPLVAYLDTHPDVGIVGPKLLNSDRSLQHSIGHITRLGDLVNEYFRRTKASQLRVESYDQPTAVEVLLGAALVVRGDLCRQVGGFDERYYMYHEETDLCLTIRKLGYQTIYLPTVSLIHHGSKSMTVNHQTRQRTQHENRKSQYLFFRKQYGLLTAQLAKLIIMVGVGSRAILLALQLPLRRDELTRLKVYYYGQTCLWLCRHW